MSKTNAHRMGMAAALLAGGVLLSRLLGFLREAIIAYFHGASNQTDAYLAAFQIPEQMSYFLAAGTLSITFIPLFSSYIAKDDEEGGWRLFSVVASTMGTILLLCIIVAGYFAPQLIPVLAPGFDDPEQIKLAVLMTRIVLPAQLLFFFGGLFQATLFVRETFWPAAISPLIYNICIILGGVLLEPYLGIVGFAVGVLVGAALGPFGLTFFAARKELKVRFLFKLKDPGFIKFVKLSFPLAIGVGLVTADQWILNYFGSLHGEGAMSWLANSRKLMMVAFAIIGQAAGQAALPFLTRLFHEGKFDEMGKMMTASLKRVSFLAIVAGAGLAALSRPIVFTVFRRGAFTDSDATITANLLIFFAMGLAFWSIQTFAVRGFYARKDTLTPMIISTSIGFIAIPIYYILQDSMGTMGLPIATSIGITLNAIATLLVYRWKNGGVEIFPIFKSILSGCFHGALSGLAAYQISKWIVLTGSKWEPLIQFSVGSLIFGIVLLILSTITRAEELDFIISKIRRRLKKA